MEYRNKHVERSQRTRAALIAVARERFGARGYAAVSTEELVRAAGVTRGALYHQFADKRELFAAVVEAVEADLAGRIAAAVAASDARDALTGLAVGAELFLDACGEPEVAQITLLDAPAVLGWEAWREVGERHGLGIVRGGLQAAMETGQVAPGPVEPLAHLLLGALDEAGLYVARAPDAARARAETGASVRRLLEGLRSAPGGPPAG